MRQFFRFIVKTLKWMIIGVVCVEVLSFLVVIMSTYWIYGQLREGSRVRYDPHALYLDYNGRRPTIHNPSLQKNPAAKVIWMFGGSTTRGVSDRDEDTIPSFLAETVNRAEPNRPVAVHNFGEHGFNSLLEVKYLQKALIELPPPQVIIFYDGANDCAYFDQHRNIDAHHGYRRVKGLVESHHRSFFGLFKPLNAALYSSFSLELWDKFMQGAVKLQPESPLLQSFLDSVERRYDYINRVAGSHGATFLLIWQPFWWVETEPVSPAVRAREKQEIILGDRLALRHNFQVTNRALLERLKNKPYFVDFRNILCSRPEPLYESDGIHLLREGNRLVADNIARVLKDRW